MAFCMNCGAMLDDDARFCGTCGTPVAVETPSEFDFGTVPATEAFVSGDIPATEPFVPADIPATEPFVPGDIPATEAYIPQENFQDIYGFNPVPQSDPQNAAGYGAGYNYNNQGAKQGRKPSVKAPDMKKAGAAAKDTANKLKGILGKVDKRILIGGGGAVALIIVVALVLSLLTGGPAAKVGKAIRKSIDNITSSGVTGLVYDVLDGGSVQMVTDLEEWANVPVSMDVKFYSNIGKQSAAFTGSIAYDGDTVLDGGVYANDSGVAVVCDDLLGEVYGLNIKNLKENLPKSVLNPDQDTRYSLDEDTYEQLMDLAESGKDAAKLSAKAEKIGNKYVTSILQSAFKNGEVESESEKFSVGSKDVRTEAITLTLDNKAMAKVFKGLSSQIKKDKDLKELVAEAYDLGQIGNTGRYRNSMTGKEYVDDLWDEIDEELSGVIESLDDRDDTKLIITFNISKSKGTLVAMTMKAKTSSDTATIKLVLGENIATSEQVSFEYKDKWDEYSIAYKVSDDTRSEYASKLVVKDNGRENLTVKFSWDKSDKSYRMTVTERWSEVTLRGGLSQKGKTTTISVDKVTSGNETVNPDLTFILNTSDKAKMPSYKDILTLTEDDMDELMENISENASDLGKTFNALERAF